MHRKIAFVRPRINGLGLADVQFVSLVPGGIIALIRRTLPSWSVQVIDDNKTGVDFNRIARECSLVAITVMVASATRAYEIGDEFRRRGVTVIMGGPHVSLRPGEAASHCDCLVTGEADVMWPKILRDFEEGNLQKVYVCSMPMDLDIEELRDVSDLSLRRAPYALKRLPFKVGYYQLGRGCPWRCGFCSVSTLFGAKIRLKSVGFAIAEIKAMQKQGMNLLVFLDDNVVGNMAYAREFFTELKKLKLHWFCQTDIRIADPEILSLAIESGLVFAFIGFESIDSEALDGSVSSAKALWSRKYESAIAELRARRVAIQGAFVFGIDGHQLSSVNEAVEWAIENKLDIAQLKVVTPLDGTELMANMEAAGRILTRDPAKYDFRHCVFQPLFTADWTPLQMELAVDDGYRKFYSVASIMHRFNWQNLKVRSLEDAVRAAIYSTLYFSTNWDYRKLANV